MSIEAINWALNDAPVNNTHGWAVLMALANHARPDGSAAFPAQSTIAHYTRMSLSAVKIHLKKLEQSGIITRCDPTIVAAYIPRWDKRPVGWNLHLDITRDDTTAIISITDSGGYEVPPATIPPHGGHLMHERGSPHAERGSPHAERGSPGGYEPSITINKPSKELLLSDANKIQKFEITKNDTADAIRLCELLAELMIGNGCKPPQITNKWISDMDRLIRLDGRTPQQVEAAIRWSQADEFWCANIKSPSKLRQQFDTLRLNAKRQTTKQPRGFSGIQQFLDKD